MMLIGIYIYLFLGVLWMWYVWVIRPKGATLEIWQIVIGIVAWIVLLPLLMGLMYYHVKWFISHKKLERSRKRLMELMDKTTDEEWGRMGGKNVKEDILKMMRNLDR